MKEFRCACGNVIGSAEEYLEEDLYLYKTGKERLLTNGSVIVRCGRKDCGKVTKIQRKNGRYIVP